LPLVHRALAKARVPIHTLRRLTAFDGETAVIADVYTGAEERLPCRSVVIVGVRAPRDDLYRELMAHSPDFARAGIASVARIGDASAPGAIVHAVHSGHRYARELDAAAADSPYRRDHPL
jgi:dimethylamine/trimethylamine dehydrogenase